MPPPKPLHNLTNKIVLITGIGAQGQNASNSSNNAWGNGTAIATLFARQGATIFGCDINSQAAEEAAKAIRRNVEVHGDLAERSGDVARDGVVDVMGGIDVTQSSACRTFFSACMQKHGRIDILINNVGRSAPGTPASLSEEEWDDQIAINLKSVYLMTHLVLPVMEAQDTGGCVLNISSIAGLRYVGKPQVGYAAAKAAIRQFTRTTAVIYAQKTQGRVRLNTVVPGLIATPLVSVLAKKYGGPDADEAQYRRTRDLQVPTGKMGTAWDVAHAALYLCSEEAGYVTGAEVVVDGGIVGSTGFTVEELAKL